MKLDFRDKAHSKVGSKDNIKHQAGGGDKKASIKTVINLGIWGRGVELRICASRGFILSRSGAKTGVAFLFL